MSTPGAESSTKSSVPTGGMQFTLNTANLDENLYRPEPEEQAFLSAQTGIRDLEELRKHILQVQKEVYAVCGPLHWCLQRLIRPVD